MDEASDKIEKERVSLSDVVSEAVSDMAPVAGKYDTGSEQEYKTGPSDRSTMRIVNDFPGGKEIIGNRSLLYSIFRNLLENAIFYSKGTTVKVSLDKEDSTMYWISVEDDGVGIDNVHMTLRVWACR